MEWDTVVIDEASMISLTISSIPLPHALRKFIIAGDRFPDRADCCWHEEWKDGTFARWSGLNKAGSFARRRPENLMIADSQSRKHGAVVFLQLVEVYSRLHLDGILQHHRTAESPVRLVFLQIRCYADKSHQISGQ